MIPLHVHSYYSLLEGTLSPAAIIEKASEYNLNAIALTDTNNMAGLIQFYKLAWGKNIKPILGAYIDEPEDKNIYCILFAKNNEGYSDICKIITTRKLKDDFSLFNLLQDYLPNLFVLTSSLQLLNNIPVYDNIFIELIITERHRKNSLLLYEAAQKRHFKYIISNPVYFAAPEDHLLHKVVSAIKYQKTVENISDYDIADKEFYFKDPQLLIDKHYRKIPEAFKNVQFIADNCNVDLQIGKYKMPKYPDLNGEDSYSFLWKLAHSGLQERYRQITPEISERMNKELDVIYTQGFTDYFLCVWDIHKEALKRGMVTVGRGSAANSLVSYCLGFTQVDPIKNNFYFERFMNKSRTSPPDIDIDFSWRERDEIVRYVFERYGYERVAMISTHVTFRARMAFREVAKTFGISSGEVSEISKKIPWTSAANLPRIAEIYPEAKSLKLNIEPWNTIVKTAAQLADFPRHLSIHPGGIVIAPGKITKHTALEFAKNKGLGLIITQPDMHAIEDIGLIKIDLLSQRGLGVMRETINQINANSSFR